MTSHPPYDPIATPLAALQQRMLLAQGGLAPPSRPEAATPAARGSRNALRTHTTTTLIAASKTQPVPVLEAAIGAGVKDFGENRMQEAAEKWPALKAAHPAIRLHLIGPLQSNKAAQAVSLFDAIHTIDRAKIADAIAAEMKAQQRAPQLLVQVNIGDEPQKAGVAVAQLPELLAHCATLGLSISGLMAVPPDGANPAPYFALIQKLADRHGLPERSMGMSNDFETAIRFGATMVRLGTALFGPRS